MKNPRFLPVIAALFAVITLTAVGSASASHAAVAAPSSYVTAAVPASGPTGYAYNGVNGIASAVNADPGMSVWTTINNARTQIWINGAVNCLAVGGGSFTWCGVGGGNGTALLDTGFNYQKLGTDGVMHKYWLRLDMTASGQCSVRGDMNGYFGLDCRA